MAKGAHLAVVLVLGRAAPVCAANDADKATFRTVCGKCHAPELVSDFKTDAEWSETVDQMVSIGAKGTKADFDAVLRYLAGNFTRVNVNTASAAQIAPVLGISETLAQTVVTYRTEHGAFTSLDDLKKVPGMNATELDARKGRIAFR